MHTSYFLFVMVITMFCYAVIKGRPSKLRQSNPEFCPEKVSGGWGPAWRVAGGLRVQKGPVGSWTPALGSAFPPEKGKAILTFSEVVAPQPQLRCRSFKHIPRSWPEPGPGWGHVLRSLLDSSRPWRCLPSASICLRKRLPDALRVSRPCFQPAGVTRLAGAGGRRGAVCPSPAGRASRPGGACRVAPGAARLRDGLAPLAVF